MRAAPWPGPVGNSPCLRKAPRAGCGSSALEDFPLVLVLFAGVSVCSDASRSKLGSSVPLLKIPLLLLAGFQPRCLPLGQARRFYRDPGNDAGWIWTKWEGTWRGHRVGMTSPQRQRPLPLNPEERTRVPMLVGAHGDSTLGSEGRKCWCQARGSGLHPTSAPSSLPRQHLASGLPRAGAPGPGREDG